ncbi:MAG TPA: sugar ABC transporter ATP-binding protein [Flexilinea sp.]|jgi:ribose transport system ATP-binding protein|nr:sugar ABC transporter ATP-binding protein [Flexilinea sp.]HOP01325.1 sugar ABC transporter ATP-binding protein [Flexilinea sp.]HOR55441.1 sugar ABC transporter ATP-binding protein [Flexilinea sp.]HOU18870.1 sugar ABC transporter ATP-binding protein [Flexilinea sp.]HPG19059.1 sugar ABC transporter ATP-binding protein [Flexilinea sp.]
MDDLLVQLVEISKTFPGVKALDHVSLDLRPGEVHALIGENGSGKSTLMKILSGVYMKDEGKVIVNGKEMNFQKPRDAQDAGIAIIHQELNLCRHLTVAENIFLGREFQNGIFLDKKHQIEEAQKILDRLEVNLDPNSRVSELTVSKQQMVEIAKAISANANVVIMDEPTSALTIKEIDDLFSIIKVLRKQGKGIIYITHRLEELNAITDRITIIRDGQHIITTDFKNLSADDIIRYMVGRELKEKFPRIQMPVGKTIFEVKNLSAGKAVRDVSFTVREGEILGIAGLMGAGRTETVRAIFGADKKDSGQLILNGQEIRIDKPQEAIETGIFCVPEDRKRDGLCISMPVYQNATLPNMEKVTHRGIVNTKKEIMIAENMVKQLTIHTPSVFQIVKNLSGGNQQKIVVGKWLVKPAHVILFDEPTRGIDVGAKVDIYNLMNQLKEQGIGVVFVSSELPEILGMADRIVVMCEGRVTAELDADEANQEIIMQYATQYM